MLLKTILSLVLLMTSPLVQAQSFRDARVGGTVKIADELKEKYHDKGVLFISLRAHGETEGPPIASFRVPRPKYPQAFVIGPQNAMIPGIPFEGPFTVFIRHSLTGDALDEDALQGRTDLETKVKLGQRDIVVKFHP